MSEYGKFSAEQRIYEMEKARDEWQKLNAKEPRTISGNWLGLLIVALVALGVLWEFLR